MRHRASPGQRDRRQQAAEIGLAVEARAAIAEEPVTIGAGIGPGAPDRGEAEPAPADDHIVVVKSSMVGTFYVAASPDSEPFVKVGDHIGPDSTVCVIEAMKVFNEIPAEISGKIVAVLAENGEPVDVGHPLFKVDTSK